MSERLLVQRVGWLCGLVSAMAGRIVAEHWNSPDLDVLAAGLGADGRGLPAKGWMALRRLDWAATVPEGVYVNDRVRRCSQEEAARALRLAVHRRQILTAIVTTWPQGARRDDADWRALRALLPPGVSAAQIANRTRQVHAYRHSHHGELPHDLADLETAPAVAAQVLLAAADRQLTTITRHDGQAVLRVQLPLTAQPRGRADWAWHVLPVALPPTVAADAKICAPTLRISGHRVRVDLPHRVTVTATKPSGHRLALGLDWGVNTLMTGVAGRLTDQGRVVTDGRMLRYDATAISAKLHRLRGHREHLAARRDHHAALAAGLPATDPRTPRLHALAERARVEHERVCARIRHLNKTLAWSAARWAVDHATALHATVIYIEDLSTLQARGTRKGNARLSGQVRGVVFEAIHHLAAKTGITVVTVPARGTSKYCPRCGNGSTELAHTPAPDRSDQRGWKWAGCPRCGLSTDRDHAAAMRITARGLLAQNHVRTDRKTGRHTTTTTVEGNVATVRRPKPCPAKQPAAGRGPKSTPTPKRPPAPASKLSHRVPDRRTAPAPPSGGQRPAGQEPKNHHPRAAASGPAHELLNPRHHPTGFHHVHATPVTALSGDFGPGTTRPRPDRNV
ncbi:zinc ribbon domain-containing protein [Catellatospora vulcania]|uniref:zinc ribbon domain-containing protein n=1 Tax=Catellatospora vulcania TaxID=1460450 RepID=UPI0018AF7EA1|nr:zinc ribbon domain-containing protein [Catellatospora vulcania]